VEDKLKKRLNTLTNRTNILNTQMEGLMRNTQKLFRRVDALEKNVEKLKNNLINMGIALDDEIHRVEKELKSKYKKPMVEMNGGMNKEGVIEMLRKAIWDLFEANDKISEAIDSDYFDYFYGDVLHELLEINRAIDSYSLKLWDVLNKLRDRKGGEDCGKEQL